jgi:penicillin amidase
MPASRSLPLNPEGSMHRLCLLSVIALIGCGGCVHRGAVGGSVAATARASVTTLDVGGDSVTIARDEFGVPHVFARTNRGLFVGYGYAVAQDRLWQLEIFRRAGYGTLSEILGANATVPEFAPPGVPPPTALALDSGIRTTRYTPAELDAQATLLSPTERELFTAYADGISRYITDVVAADPVNKLPYEFKLLGLGVPAPYTLRDVFANCVIDVRFGEIGGRERQNQGLLNALVAKYGSTGGLAVFNDVVWLDDPDSPVSVPRDRSTRTQERGAAPLDQRQAESDDAHDSLWSLPTGIGSHGFVIAASRSATGTPILFGAPQAPFTAPDLFLEVQLKGGDGFDVTGATFAGLPFILAGHNDDVAFTMFTGSFGDNVDTYLETLCDDETGYLFNGVCTPFESRTETIASKDGSPTTRTVQRTVHGPVVGRGPGVAFSQKRTDWKREVKLATAWLALDRAHNLDEFQAGLRQLPISLNFVCADKAGNIAYFGPADVPVRPSGYDPRLPLPGTGKAEWAPDLVPMPKAINPAQGWLASWNNKPALGWRNPDNRSYGKQFRALDLFARLESAGLISENVVADIEKDVSRSAEGGDGRESRYLLPYLLAAVAAVPPSNALATRAIAVLKAWDGGYFADPVSSETLAPGRVIFGKWLSRMLASTFEDELGPNVNRADENMLLHVLDDRLGGGSGVPPSRDYFNGADPNVVMSRAFDSALTALGPDATAWSTVPRDMVHIRSLLFPRIPEGAAFLNANRGTYTTIVVLEKPHIRSMSIIALGQSGVIRGTPPDPPSFDPHFADQLALFKEFRYKSLHYDRDTNLKE